MRFIHFRFWLAASCDYPVKRWARWRWVQHIAYRLDPWRQIEMVPTTHETYE